MVFLNSPNLSAPDPGKELKNLHFLEYGRQIPKTSENGLRLYICMFIQKEPMKNATVKKFTWTKFLRPIRLDSPRPALQACAGSKIREQSL